MGCFLGCFGAAKDRKRRKQRRKVEPRNHFQSTPGENPEQPSVSLVKDVPEKPVTPVSEKCDKPEEQLSSNTRKKVTFDTNVKTYEHIVCNESIDFSSESEDNGKNEENSVKSSQSQSSSGNSSITSSSGSYPTNHRYQNCRESDDEEDELDDVESDPYDDDDGVLDDEDDDGFDEDVDVDDRISVVKGVYTEEVVDSSLVMDGLPQEEEERLKGGKPVGVSHSIRDRSGYVHPVLNPVENLTQWKALKAKGKLSLKPQKENFNLVQEPRGAFSLEPTFRDSSFSFKSNSDHQSKKPNQEVAVDASLSTWLSSSEATPISKNSTIGLDAVTPEKSMSYGSNTPRSPEDRPILGALTLEEIKQFSASSVSPKRSPSRSPDEMPIIGTVGTYWSHHSTAKDPGSASSFKGIPNTTSKYREDKRVNWHSTPFETRLERALNRDAADKAYSHPTNVC